MAFPHVRFILVAAALYSIEGIAGAAGNGSSGKLMTRDELRTCLKQDQDNKAATDDVVKMQAELDRQQADIARESALIKADSATLDQTDAAAVGVFKTRAQALDANTDSYNQRLPLFNAKVQALEAARTDYQTHCANRKYDENDYFAIKHGK